MLQKILLIAQSILLLNPNSTPLVEPNEMNVLSDFTFHFFKKSVEPDMNNSVFNSLPFLSFTAELTILLFLTFSVQHFFFSIFNFVSSVGCLHKSSSLCLFYLQSVAIILSCLGMTIGTAYLYYPINETACFLNFPLIAWLTLASSVNIYVWLNNKEKGE